MSQVQSQALARTGHEALPAGRPLERLLASVTATDASRAQILLRGGLALVLFPHGAQKALGWFGGFGFEGTMAYLTGPIGAPWILAFLAIVVEFVGPALLVLGLLGRVVAFGIANVMVVAVVTSHLTHGFFMDWGGTMAGEGYEYHLLVIAMAGALLIGGSGALSVDRRIAGRLQRS